MAKQCYRIFILFLFATLLDKAIHAYQRNQNAPLSNRFNNVHQGERNNGMNRLHKTTSMGALHNTNDIGNYYLSNEGGLSDGEAGIMNPQTFQHGGQTKIRGYASDDHLSRYRYIIFLFRLSCLSGLSSF